ncbi:MAG: 5'-nucleotidase C-terminal domain-containing protein [Planctomycetota bacterium]|nr:5'-nucleotidase C-terminal domain-containing protein [Planctomycetota bacterium]
MWILIVACLLGLQAGDEPPSAAEPETVEITIFHTAGFSSAFDRAPILHRIVQAERKLTDAVLLVDTGNHMDPAILETTLSEGKINIDIMNWLGYDAMAIGMGELQYGRDMEGRESIAKRTEEAKFPLLSSNLLSIASNGEKRPVAFSTWAQPRDCGGLRVGFIGVTSLGSGGSEAQRRVRERFSAGPELAAVERQYRMLKNKVDLIIVLSNCGNQVDFALATSIEIDLLIGVSAVDLGGDPIVNLTGYYLLRSREDSRSVGKIRLQVRLDTHTVVDLKYERVPLEGEGDAELAGQIAKSSQWLREAWDLEVGTIAGTFSAAQSADLVADVIREASRAEVSFCDSGEIVRAFPEGPITKMDLWALIPRRRPLVKFRVRGGALRSFLEDNLRLGGPYRLAGVSYVFDPTKPEGQQITSIRVGKGPLREDRPYLCVADGGTLGSSEFFQSVENRTETGQTVHPLLEEYFRRNKGPVEAPDEPRAVRKIPVRDRQEAPR